MPRTEAGERTVAGTRTTAGQRQVARDFVTCLQFNGSAYVTIGANAAIQTSVFTYAAWVKLNALGKTTTACIIGDSTGSGSRGPEFRIGNGTNLFLNLLEENVADMATSTRVIPCGIWTHVALSYSASGAYAFYINGVVSGTGTNLRTFAHGTKYIGSQIPLVTEGFAGKIDDVRIYNAVMTATDIANIYNGIEPATTNLKGYWKFDEASGTAVIDSAGINANGTITSATYSTDVVMIPRTTAA